MKKDTLLYIAVIILLVGQGYLMVKINEKDEVSIKALEAVDTIIEQNKAAVEAGNKLIEKFDSSIAGQFDTLRIIERQKIEINNNYENDLSTILHADSGLQFDLYRKYISRYDSTFPFGPFASK